MRTDTNIDLLNRFPIKLNYTENLKVRFWLGLMSQGTRAVCPLESFDAWYSNDRSWLMQNASQPGSANF